MNSAVDVKTLKKVMGQSWPMVKMVFDDLPMGVVITDAGGMIAYYNQAQLDIDGLKASEVVGQFLTDIYSPYPSSIILNCLCAQKPILNHWQFYNSRTIKNIQAISQAIPLFLGDKLSGCISFTKRYLQMGFGDFLNDVNYEDSAADPKINFGRLVGRSPKFVKAIKAAKAGSENNLPVLIYGETGVGKELFARGIHNASARAKKAFVAVNCSAIPENLFEGLMFGVSRGAFTGAVEKVGFFEEANGGTIYLDEIDSMPLLLQPKVLRVIQEGEVRRLSSSRDLSLDVKVISSMSQDPFKAIKNGRFRSDLFYRLGAIIINIPPLRERMDDLPLLMDHFIAKHSASLGKKIKWASHDFVELLKNSAWPGNVRELEHIITGAITLAKARRQTIGVDLVPEYFKNLVFYGQNSKIHFSTKGNGNSEDLPRKRKAEDATAAEAAAGQVEISFADQKKDNLEAEKRLIGDYLKRSFGNVALAARLMGLSPQVLHYKIKKSKIAVKDFKSQH